MTVHLIKLSVGPDSLADMVQWQTERLKEKKARGQKPELFHVTRHKPKREDEVLDGGSIYWVIKGLIVARQKLVELRPIEWNGVPSCALIYDKEMVRVQMRPRKAFQGWRYLDTKDAPPDITTWNDNDAMTDTIQRELVALGLL